MMLIRKEGEGVEGGPIPASYYYYNKVDVVYSIYSMIQKEVSQPIYRERVCLCIRHILFLAY